MTDVQQNGQGPPPPEILTVPRDTSFEHQLDETAPKPEPVHDGDGMEIPRLGGERLPIVPEHLRTLAGIWSTVCKYLDAARFHALFHALRSPKYLVLSVIWAVVGVGRLARAQIAWWSSRSCAPRPWSTATRPSGGRCTPT